MVGYIYFLLQDQTVVYVGKTIDYRTRLRSGHRDKTYNCVRIIPCRTDEMGEYEKRWIRRFRPYYNQQFHPNKNHVPIIPGRTVLHEAFFKAEIARRYYKKRGIELEKEPARKRFLLDKNVDLKLIDEVNDEIHREQKTMLKNVKHAKKKKVK